MRERNPLCLPSNTSLTGEEAIQIYLKLSTDPPFDTLMENHIHMHTLIYQQLFICIYMNEIQLIAKVIRHDGQKKIKIYSFCG